MCLKPIVLFVVLSVSTASTAWAQTRGEQKQIFNASSEIVSAPLRGEIRSLDTSATQATERYNDSVLNGALIGAGVGVASGLAFCRLMEPWDVCLSSTSGLLTTGALGAGIGIGIDLLIRGRRPIEQPPAASTQIQAVPVVGRGGGGLHFSVRF